MRRRFALPFGALASVIALAVGCVPTGTPSPSPGPTSPAVQSSPSSPSPTENEQEREERLAYAEAERAYRIVSAEYDRVASEGGSLRPTPILKQYAGGQFLEQYATGLKQQKEINARSAGKSQIVYVKPAGYSSTYLQLTACEDGTDIKIVSTNGKVLGTGIVAEIDLTARKRDGKWIMWELKENRVKSC